MCFYNPKKTFALIFVGFLFILLGSVNAMAHRVNVFAYTSGDDIIVEGSFGDKTPAQKSKVSVYNQTTGALILEGETDEKGIFKFARPQVDSALKIVLVAGMGHQNYWIVTREDLGLPPAGSTAATTEETKAEPAVATTSQSGATSDTASANVNMQELTEMVTQVVAREIAPIKRMMLEEKESGPSIVEIFGGIGWLIGLAGVAAYMKNRK